MFHYFCSHKIPAGLPPNVPYYKCKYQDMEAESQTRMSSEKISTLPLHFTFRGDCIELLKLTSTKMKQCTYQCKELLFKLCSGHRFQVTERKIPKFPQCGISGGALTHSSSCQSACRDERLLLHLASSVSWSLRSTTCSESADGEFLEAM